MAGRGRSAAMRAKIFGSVTPAPSPPPTPSSTFIAVVPLLGQSDMEGRGLYSAGTDTNDPKVKQFCGYPGSSATYRTIRDDIYPLYHFEAPDSSLIGPGQTLGKQLAADLGPNCAYVLLVPCAVGGTGLVAPGAEWGLGNSLHENAVSQINLAVAAAKAIHPASYVHSMHWIQGNNDGTTPEATYKTALAAVIADYRSRCTTVTSTTPFVMGSMLPIAIETQAGKQSIERAQLAVAAEGTNVFYVPGPYGSVRSDEAPNYIHMGTGGCRTVGINLAKTAQGQHTVSFARLNRSVIEGNSGSVSITHEVYRTNSVGSATAPITFVPGTTSADDFAGGAYPTGLSATWASGQNRATVTININPDTTLEADEAYSLNLTAPSGYTVGTRPTVNATIVNDDTDNTGTVDADGFPAAGLLHYADASKPNTLWQDANRTVPAVNPGDPILAISDSGPNGHNGGFTAGATLGTVNGKPAIVFPGGTTRGGFSSLVNPTNNFSSTSQFSIHDVQVQDSNGSMSMWSLGNGASSRINLQSPSAGGPLIYTQRNSGGTTVSTTVTGSTTVLGVPTVTSLRRKLDGQTSILQDGVMVFDAVVPISAIADIINFAWGARLASGAYDQYLIGKKQAIRTYSLAQSDADFLAAHNRMRALHPAA